MRFGPKLLFDPQRSAGMAQSVKRIFCVRPTVLQHGDAGGDLDRPEHPGQKIAVVLDLAGAVGEDQAELALFGQESFHALSVFRRSGLIGIFRVLASDFGGPNLLNRSTRRQT